MEWEVKVLVGLILLKNTEAADKQYAIRYDSIEM